MRIRESCEQCFEKCLKIDRSKNITIFQERDVGKYINLDIAAIDEKKYV